MEKKILIVASLFLLAGLFINLGVQPLYLEEPRRTMVAMEMAESGNYIVPTQMGAFYYKKPPGFNWVLLASSSLFGGFTEFALRLPTVLSTIAISLLIFFCGKHYVNERFGWLSSLLFLGGGAILFYFSSLAEIDLFYALITFGSFLSLFHFYQKKQWWSLFLVTYLLGALGTLTKSLPSVLFTGISILVYFLYKRDFRRLFSPMHLAGIFVYVLVVGGYLFAYAQYNDLSEYFINIWGDSSERTVLNQGLAPLLGHIFQFPLDILVDTLPASFFLLFLVRKDVIQLIRQNELLTFAALIFLANIPVYWFSPGAKQRYVYMLYPLLVMVYTYAFLHKDDLAAWRFKAFRILAGFIVGVPILGAIALTFIPDLQFLGYLLPLSILLGIGASILLYFYIKNPAWSVALLLLTLGLSRIVFDLTVLPQRAHKSGAAQDMSYATTIDSIVGKEDLFVLKDSRFSFTTVVYLNKIRGENLKTVSSLTPDTYYIGNDTLLSGQPHETYFKFDYHGQKFSLVRFSKPTK